MNGLVNKVFPRDSETRLGHVHGLGGSVRGHCFTPLGHRCQRNGAAIERRVRSSYRRSRRPAEVVKTRTTKEKNDSFSRGKNRSFVETSANGLKAIRIVCRAKSKKIVPRENTDRIVYPCARRHAR